MEEEYMFDILFQKDSVIRVTVGADEAGRVCRSERLVVSPLVETAEVVMVDNPSTPIRGHEEILSQ